MEYAEITAELKSMANPVNVEGMARFGISAVTTRGISIYALRKLAKKIGKRHELALRLWDSGYHEARILPSFSEEPGKVTEAQRERWVADFDSWDVCDQVSELISQTPFVIQKIHEWAGREETFVKRTAFSLIAEIAWHDKKRPYSDFEPLFRLIKDAATDERNFVKKAVNWALRNIGKRNPALNARAVAVAKEIQQLNLKSARWIAADAIRELTSEAVQKRLKK